MADEGPGTESRGTGSASALIERERDLLKIREDAARGVDVQAAAITAATLTLVAVAAASHAFDKTRDGWLIAGGVLLFLSALAGGIARLPAPPPLKAMLMQRERDELYRRYDRGPDARLRRLGREFGAEIRQSEERLRSRCVLDSSESLTAALLAHWRARNQLARYRMHSKSAWFTLSLVLLYGAVLVFVAGTL